MSHATAYWLCAILLFSVGFAATSQMAATNTIIQERVPDELRSRLMAVYATMFMGVQPLGALLAGEVGKRIGTPDTVLLFGLVVLAGCLIFIWWVAARVGKTQVGAMASG
jgi:MFS family permease